ncbi:metalloregulator ArsR/SmtB family transcription factor [Oleispirillum naphthae]|uniref:ArsR/SmtB family transcription factor n=1 Tax=Oleispirillum naphthae TaxID=2838853 RepID=UPI0030824F21
MSAVLACLKALAEPTRLRLARLCARDDLTVSDLTALLGGSQPGISRHLKLLVEGGVLDRFREGSWVFYRLARRGAAAAVVEAALAALPEDDPALAADLARLKRLEEVRSARARGYFAAVAADWDRLRALQADEAVVDAAIRALVCDRPVRSLLDIGTGTAHMLTLLGPEVAHGQGIDLSPEMLALARENLAAAGLRHCLVRQADMERLPGDLAGFDMVVFHQVLHYARRPAAAVAEAARVLAPGGRVMVVDFLPHGLDELRTEHNHARLGFPAAEVASWFSAAELAPVAERRVPGDPLTVGIWMGEKRA